MPAEPPRYVIGSGWWCSGGDEAAVNPKRKLRGASLVREVAFFRLWRESIDRFTRPAAIAVVDSCSPVKPDPALREGIAWIELPFNARHSTAHLGQWSGWTRSVLVGGQYALAADADYFVYVEQDCLLQGEGIVEHCIDRMTGDFMFGDGRGTPQPLQQSFFIIRRSALSGFLHNLCALKRPDSALSPEWKFLYATWRPFVAMSNAGLLWPKPMRLLARAMARRWFYQSLPVGSGRVRPLPLDAPFHYFQHGSLEETGAYIARNGLEQL